MPKEQNLPLSKRRTDGRVSRTCGDRTCSAIARQRLQPAASKRSDPLGCFWLILKGRELIGAKFSQSWTIWQLFNSQGSFMD